MKAASLAWRGTTLRSWTSGPAGAPWLVICHGGALDHRGFRSLAESLAEKWRVLLWDFPGHGESQPMPRGFSVPLCANALAAVMDAHGAARAVLLGFSFGGMVAQYFARAHPDRVTALIAYSCFAPFLVAAPVPRLVRPIVMLLGFRLRGWDAVRLDFARRCSAVPAVQEDVQRAMQPLGKPGFLRMTGALIDSFTPDPAFRVAAPLLIISGEHDSNGAALRQSLAALRAAHPGSAEIVLPNAGHCAHAENPVQFETALRPFLNTVLAGAAI